MVVAGEEATPTVGTVVAAAPTAGPMLTLAPMAAGVEVDHTPTQLLVQALTVTAGVGSCKAHKRYRRHSGMVVAGEEATPTEVTAVAAAPTAGPMLMLAPMVAGAAVDLLPMQLLVQALTVGVGGS